MDLNGGKVQAKTSSSGGEVSSSFSRRDMLGGLSTNGIILLGVS
jgi:hypothetical protein